MDDVMVFLVMGAVLVGIVLLARRARRGRHGRAIGAAMAAIDEVWHPNAHAAHVVIEVQDERKVPIPAPGDRPLRLPPLA